MSKILLANIKGATGDVTPAATAAKAAAEAAAATATTKAAEATAAAAAVPTAEELGEVFATRAESSFVEGSGYVPTGRYEPNTGIYNLTGANWAQARTSLAKAHSGDALCRIVYIGTSITAGWTAAKTSTDMPSSVARDYLAKLGYPIAGTGDVMAGARGVYGATQPDDRWVNGSWTILGSGLNNDGGFGILSIGPGSGAAVFTSDFAGTVAEYVYARNTGLGTLQVVVKNSAGTVLATNSYTTAGTVGAVRVTLTGLVLDVGSTITFTSTSGPVAVFAAGVRKTTGVLVSNLAVGSGNTQTYTTPSATLLNATLVSKAVVAAGIDILMIDHGLNDANHQYIPTSIGQFRANLATIISSFGSPLKSTALIHPIPANVQGGLWQTPTASGYSSKTFYETADLLNLPLLDHNERWQSFSLANAAGMFSDHVHTTRAGGHRKGLDEAALLIA